MATILAAEHVTKQFALDQGRTVTALRDLSLSVEEGEVVCILGASGCGKSTLIDMFAGFTKPTSGRLTLRGRPITGVDPRCGMVFQSYALFPWKTVRRNVEFALRMRGVGRHDRRRAAAELIGMVKLEGFEESYPAELSGGMRQRVTLARALAADPEVLLMDEPFAALDAMTRQVMQEELLRIQETSGKTVLFITHSIDEALILSHRLVVLSARPGRIAAIIENPLPRPRHADVQLTPEYAALKASIWGLVEQEVLRHGAPSAGH